MVTRELTYSTVVVCAVDIYTDVCCTVDRDDVTTVWPVLRVVLDMVSKVLMYRTLGGANRTRFALHPPDVLFLCYADIALKVFLDLSTVNIEIVYIDLVFR